MRFERRMTAGWGDMDFNAHMRNTAYLDMSATLRMMFFAEHGFPMDEFRRLRVGPVVPKDEIDYLREVNLIDELRVDLSIAGLADDGSRWLMRNEFFRPDGNLAARVTSAGGWLDLATRKLVAPPATLRAVLDVLPRTSDCQTLPTSLK